MPLSLIFVCWSPSPIYCDVMCAPRTDALLANRLYFLFCTRIGVSCEVHLCVAAADEPSCVENSPPNEISTKGISTYFPIFGLSDIMNYSCEVPVRWTKIPGSSLPAEEHKRARQCAEKAALFMKCFDEFDSFIRRRNIDINTVGCVNSKYTHTHRTYFSNFRDMRNITFDPNNTSENSHIRVYNCAQWQCREFVQK